MSDTVATSTGVVAASRDTDTRSSPGSAAKPAVGRGSTCSGCGRAISDRFLLYAMDRHWHVGCLRCSVCQMPLDDAVATCYTRAGLILCRTDYLRMFGSTGTCAACHQPIPASQLVMRARQDAYHVDCFTCAVCGVRLVPGDRFAIVAGSLVCESDYPKICAGLQAERRHQSAGVCCISGTGAGMIDSCQ